MMKKITFLFALLISSIGFSQTELLTNGDFANGTTDWTGSTFTVVSGEAFFSAPAAGGNPWDTQLVQGGFPFTNGQEYTLTFKARAAANRPITVAIQNVGVWSDQFRQDFNLTTVMTEYTATFNANLDFADVQVGFLMAGTGNTEAVYYDDISLTTNGAVAETCSDGIQNQDETGVDCGGVCAPCATPPATAAPTPPARPAADVVSIYSDAYTGNIVFDNFDAGWCGGASVTGVMISGNNTLQKNAGIDCQGIDFNTDRQDLSGFTHIHFDFYTNDVDLVGDVFNVKLVDFGGGGMEASALEVNINTGTTPAIVAGSWVSVDVDITALGGVVANNLTRSDVAQIGITTTNLTNVWYDNIYLHKNTVLSTDDFKEVSFKVYPNPTQDNWTVKSKNQKIETVEVYDMLGKQVMSFDVDATETEIDGSNLKTGLYFAQIKTEDSVDSIKLVKR